MGPYGPHSISYVLPVVSIVRVTASRWGYCSAIDIGRYRYYPFLTCHGGGTARLLAAAGTGAAAAAPGARTYKHRIDRINK